MLKRRTIVCFVLTYVDINHFKTESVKSGMLLINRMTFFILFSLAVTRRRSFRKKENKHVFKYVCFILIIPHYAKVTDRNSCDLI